MATRKNENVKEEGKGQELDLDQLDAATGGNNILIAPNKPNAPIAPNPLTADGNPFSDVPRVPLQPIDPGLRENA